MALAPALLGSLECSGGPRGVGRAAGEGGLVSAKLAPRSAAGSCGTFLQTGSVHFQALRIPEGVSPLAAPPRSQLDELFADFLRPSLQPLFPASIGRLWGWCWDGWLLGVIEEWGVGKGTPGKKGVCI